MTSDRVVLTLVRLVTAALMAGGAVGALTSFALRKGAWPWPMPDLAYRFLAGAATAYAVGGLITLRRDWAASELLLVTVILYGIPLGLAILIDADEIDWDEPVAWEFLGLVVPALVISAGALWRNRGRLEREAGEPLGRALRVYLLGLGGLATVLGALVYVAPRKAGFVWPWAELSAWKPLDSRLLASMLLTIGLGALLTTWRDRRAMADVLLPMLWAYCVVTGIGLALHADKTPALRTEDYVYIGIFAMLLVDTVALYLWQRVRQPSAVSVEAAVL